ncbi:MAG: hypothetical protein HUJ56_04815 [Erysipelotrichaceae bacterium]|nr:hypothetical protein [Erysipelotrichaceae bacterium]
MDYDKPCAWIAAPKQEGQLYADVSFSPKNPMIAVDLTTGQLTDRSYPKVIDAY